MPEGNKATDFGVAAGSLLSLSYCFGGKMFVLGGGGECTFDSVEKSIFVEAINFVDRALIYPCLYFLHR